ncbi:DMT family transporter [Chitinolyticbacter meiyuanensis]|uniref:DMT family transporter n=1 Tax=Chitinolyticbacter meiyuanensis TaxID=682798 RepID=UPI0011E5D121|nr:DMT family transporter [Chitinolyticbacter meiyuanensis]
MNPWHQALRRWHTDGRLYAVLSAAGFSLKAVFVKLGYAAGPVDALTLLAMRMALALPLFGWLIWLSRREGHAEPLSRLDWLRVVLLGTFGYYLSSLFDFYGLEYISAGLERLILYVYPTLVLLLHAALTRQRPGRRVVQAMAICYLGLGVAFVHDISLAGHGAQVLTGAAWVFVSAVTYALYYLGTGAMLKRLGSMRLAGLAGAVSSVLVLGHYAVAGSPAQLTVLPPAVWWNAGLMALLSTALPVYWMALAIQRMGASQAAAIGSLGPVLTLLASWLLLGEVLSLYQIAGLALVMFGVSRLKPAQPAPAVVPQSAAEMTSLRRSEAG